MRSSHVILLVASHGLVAGTAAGALAESRPAVELRATEVVLPMISYGNRPLVEVMSNGSGPYRLILDTGAAGSLLDLGLAEELGLPVVEEEQIGSPAGGEPVPSKVVAFDSMALGDAVISSGRTQAADLAGFFRDETGPRGVLSAALFDEFLLRFDYPGQRIVITAGSLPRPDGAEVIAYEELDGLPSLPVTLGGRTIYVYMDTGFPGAVALPTKYADELPLVSPPVGVGRARTVDREMVIHAAPAAP